MASSKSRSSIKKHRPVIGITIGEPAGIGPEVIRKALAGFSAPVDVVVIGDASGFRPGSLTKRSASVARQALEDSVSLLRAGAIHAVVNAPVHKGNLQKVGFPFPGQTEFYAKRFGLGPKDVTMTLTSSKLTVGLVTTHCSLRQAITRLQPEEIVATAERLARFLNQQGIKRPHLALPGLNPHAGEGGAFGNEEEKILKPTLRALARRKSFRVSGPHSPDAIFREATTGACDGVIALYHDQGLIPFKMASFEDGVNVTLGLPVWRMSPDHGTALNIAGRDEASPASMRTALELAARLLLHD